MDKSNFKVFVPEVGAITMHINKKYVSFSKRAGNEIGNPEFIQVLLDEDSALMAILPSDKNTKNSFRFYRNNESKKPIYIQSVGLVKKLGDLAARDFSAGDIVSVMGVHDDSDNTLIFDLKIV